MKNLLISKVNYIFKSSHPSPLSSHRGFIGCKHFSLSNELLVKNKKNRLLVDLDNLSLGWFKANSSIKSLFIELLNI